MSADRDLLPTTSLFVNDVRIDCYVNDSGIAHAVLTDGHDCVELIGAPARIVRFAGKVIETMTLTTEAWAYPDQKTARR